MKVERNTVEVVDNTNTWQREDVPKSIQGGPLKLTFIAILVMWLNWSTCQLVP